MIRLLPAVLLSACSPASDAAQGPSAGQSAGAADTQITDRATLGGGEAVLVTRDNGCVLQRKGQADLPLAPAPPCRFLRAEGQVQQHAYPKRGIDAVVMVVGTPADMNDRAKFGVEARLECGTVAHGLVVRGDKVTAARKPQRGGMFCVDQGRDEKDFYTVAHER